MVLMIGIVDLEEEELQARRDDSHPVLRDHQEGLRRARTLHRHASRRSQRPYLLSDLRWDQEVPLARYRRTTLEDGSLLRPPFRTERVNWVLRRLGSGQGGVDEGARRGDWETSGAGVGHRVEETPVLVLSSLNDVSSLVSYSTYLGLSRTLFPLMLSSLG
jgi:hypothetical protein